MFRIVAHVAARALDRIHQGSPFGRKVERFRAFGCEFQLASAGPKLVVLRPEPVSGQRRPPSGDRAWARLVDSAG